MTIFILKALGINTEILTMVHQEPVESPDLCSILVKIIAKSRKMYNLDNIFDGIPKMLVNSNSTDSNFQQLSPFYMDFPDFLVKS